MFETDVSRNTEFCKHKGHNTKYVIIPNTARIPVVSHGVLVYYRDCESAIIKCTCMT